jgi:hypothetical protein
MSPMRMLGWSFTIILASVAVVFVVGAAMFVWAAGEAVFR